MSLRPRHLLTTAIDILADAALISFDLDLLLEPSNEWTCGTLTLRVHRPLLATEAHLALVLRSITEDDSPLAAKFPSIAKFLEICQPSLVF